MSPHRNKQFPLVTLGSVGRHVAIAQTLLIKSGRLAEKMPNGKSNIDGKAGKYTVEAVKDFQREDMKLTGDDVDGKIGNKTWPRLLEIDPIFESEVVIEFPTKPSFKSMPYTTREAIFGKFDYAPKYPQTSKGEEIEIHGDWAKLNIHKFWIPQLENVPLFHPDSTQKCSGFISLHKLAGPVFQKFFDRVELLGYRSFIETFDGSFYPRYQRGSRTALSNHSWGTAIDLNAFANGLNKTPARMGEAGCLLPLVEIANEFGIYWGGHFSRSDPMHFEIALL